jgi:hypothetical protein
MAVKVTFTYEPDEPDDHSAGMSEEEYQRLMEQLMALGAEDINVEKA